MPRRQCKLLQHLPHSRTDYEYNLGTACQQCAKMLTCQKIFCNIVPKAIITYGFAKRHRVNIRREICVHRPSTMTSSAIKPMKTKLYNYLKSANIGPLKISDVSQKRVFIDKDGIQNSVLVGPAGLDASPTGSQTVVDSCTDNTKSRILADTI